MLSCDRKQVKSIGYFGAVIFMAAALGSGCSAQSQTNIPRTASVSAPFTNAAMEKFQKPSEAELRQKLTPKQFEVTQHAATEPSFQNEFWNKHEPGIYVDIVSGQPLFSSLDKFDSGCGWPSFYAPTNSTVVAEQSDRSHFMDRTEVLCAKCGGHLGHVFDDGPQPTGLRYCINSASLKFEKK